MKKTQETFGYTPEQYKLFRNYAIRYLILFSLLYCFLYCTRLNLAGAGAAMTEGLGWTSEEFGILTSVLFWAYGIGQLITGRLSEIVGTSRFVMLSVILSAAVNLIMGFQSSLLVMAILWGFNGLFQSMAWTPGLSALTNWWPGSTRGFATGFTHAFSGFGQAAATLAVALSFAVLPNMGWRAAFLLPVAFPLCMLILYKLFARSSPSDIGIPEYKEEDPERAENEEKMKNLIAEKGQFYPYKFVLSDFRFWLWIIIAFIAGLARYGLSTWIPMYFVDRFKLDITAGLLQSLTLPVGMGIGTLIVPWLTDRFCPNNRLPAVIVSSILGAASVAGIIFLDPRSTGQMILLQCLQFLAGFCIYAISGVGWAYATDIGGRVFSGTSSGILNFSSYIGAAVQSVIYGFLLNRMGWNVVFLSIAVLCAAITILGVIGSNRKGTKNRLNFQNSMI